MSNETGCVVTGDRDLKLLKRLTDEVHSRVEKVEHTVNNKVIVKKTFLNYYPEPEKQTPIVQRLIPLGDYNSNYLVSINGAFIERACVSVCMEYMDRGSFEDIYKQTGPIDIDILGKVALAVLEGTVYLHDIHYILHEDIKPSNILVNSKGEIKLTDFATARIAEVDKAFIGGSGTSMYYLSPERVRAAQYTPRTLKSEVWALGISLVELALGRHPYFEGDEPLTILEVLYRIANGPPPRLSMNNAGGCPAEVENFVDNCLMVDVERRSTPDELLRHPWMNQSRLSMVDVGLWATKVL